MRSTARVVGFVAVAIVLGLATAGGCADLKSAADDADAAAGADGSASGDAGSGDGGDLPDGAPRDGAIEDVIVVSDAGRCDGAPCPPVLLAKDLVLPIDIAVDSTHVYWAEYGPQNQGLEGTITRIPTNTTCVLADAGCRDVMVGQAPSGIFRVNSVALASQDLCWIEFYEDQREVHCRSLVTGTKRTVSQNNPGGQDLVVDGNELYWVNGGTTAAASNGAVVHTPLTAIATTPVKNVATGRPFPTGVALDVDTVYWSEIGVTDGGAGVMAAFRDGGSRRSLASGQKLPYGVAVYGAYVYWLDEGTGTIWRAAKDGATAAAAIVTSQESPYDIAVDATGVYWIARGSPPNYLDGRVMRAELDGTGVTPLDQNLPYPVTIAIDSTFVYYAMYGTAGANYLDGKLMKVGKR
jgi:DNA-binding beta-propeller fold protein YncE